MGRVITAEDLFSIRLAGQVEAHWDGRLFFTEAWADRETDERRSRLMVIRPGSEAAPFTEGPFDTSPRLSPDGAQIAFLRKKDQRMQVWLISTSGGEARQLTHLSQGVSDFTWSPDGASLAILTPVHGGVLRTEEEAARDDDPGTKFTKDVHIFSKRMYRLDGEGYLDDPVELARVDLSGSATLLTHTNARISDLSFSKGGREIFFIAHLSDDIDPDRGEVWSIGSGGGEPQPHLVSEEWSAEGLVSAPGVEGALALVTESRLLGYGDVHLAHLVVGRPPRLLGLDLGRTLGNSSASDLVPPSGATARLDPSGRAVVAVAARDGACQLVRIPLDGGTSSWLTEGDHVISAFALTEDGPVAAVQSADVVSEIMRFAPTGTQRLTYLNAAFESEVDLARPRRFTARAEDGPEIDAWLLMPPRQALPPSGRIPAVLQIHGGPMSFYARAVFIEHQLIAAQGVAVIASNPRGSTGYGEAFCDAIRAEWGKADYEDLMAVTDAALSLEPRLDASNLGVAGGSYGGYMTNWIVGHTDRFKAAHTMRSCVDWRTMGGTSDCYWYWPKRAGGAMPWEDDGFTRQQSPITYARNMKTPILIEHQEGDFRCPIDQDMQLYGALKLLGQAEAVFVIYPGEFHGMSRTGKPWHRVHRLRLIVEWWRAKLLGEAPSGVLKAHVPSITTQAG